MTRAHPARTRDVPLLGLRPHARLMSEVVVFAVLSLGGAALAIADARIVAANSKVPAIVNVGWAMVAVGALVAVATATLGVLRARLRARIEECASGCVLSTFPVASMMPGGAVFARLPDGSRQRWRLDSRRPLLILGDPPLLLGVTTPGRDGPPIGIAENGHPFAAGPALADLLAAAREMGATVAGEANVGGAGGVTDTARRAIDDADDVPDCDRPAHVARAALPLSRPPPKKNTVIACRRGQRAGWCAGPLPRAC